MTGDVRRAGFVERQVDAGDVRLNYVEGPKNGPPLLLIPGQTMPWESYRRVLPGLSRRFHVLAMDVRGHGRSTWSKGNYSFPAMAKDAAAVLRASTTERAIVSGNSSGGVAAVALASMEPDLVRALVPEDPPLFSCEHPRILSCYVAIVLRKAVDALGDGSRRDLPKFFDGFEVPVQGSARIMKFPKPAVWLVGAMLKLHRLFKPTGPVDLPFLPLPIRLFVRGLSEYDPDFAAACLDGRINSEFAHADALSRVTCPVHLLWAHAFMHPTMGLVGAMNDDDIANFRTILPAATVQKVDAAHVVHVDAPKLFIDAIEQVATRTT